MNSIIVYPEKEFSQQVFLSDQARYLNTLEAVYKNLVGKKPCSTLVFIKTKKILPLELSLFTQLKKQFPFLTLIVLINQKNNPHEDSLYYFSHGIDYPLFYLGSEKLASDKVATYLKQTTQGLCVKKDSSFGLNFARSSVFAAGTEIKLSKTEFQLLYFLYQNKGKIVSKELLLEVVWGYKDTAFTKTLEVTVSKLRSKIIKVGLKNLIKTNYGQGYILDLK